MSQRAITLEEREQAYMLAEKVAEREAERYVEARASGSLGWHDIAAMDRAEADLIRAKRRLEATQHRIQKSQR